MASSDPSRSFVDTHAHLDDEQFQADRFEVLQRAAAAGVAHIVVVGTTAPASAACVALADQYPRLSAAVGIQPNHVAEAALTDWDEIVRLVEHPRVVAVGETGLDRHWDYTPFPRQEDYFSRHLELGRRHGLAVVIHCREAESDVVRMLRADYDRHGPVRAVMHSFSGDAATAAACLEMGLFLSFAGMITYKNAEALREVAKGVPLDRLLVETDSPYLAPVPVRGRRNEPAFLTHTAACLATLYGIAPSALAAATSRNAQTLFAAKDRGLTH